MVVAQKKSLNGWNLFLDGTALLAEYISYILHRPNSVFPVDLNSFLRACIYICTRRTVPPAGHGWSEQRFISLPKATDNNFSLEMHATHKKPMQAMDRTTRKATVLGLFSRFFFWERKLKKWQRNALHCAMIWSVQEQRRVKSTGRVKSLLTFLGCTAETSFLQKWPPFTS